MSTKKKSPQRRRDAEPTLTELVEQVRKGVIEALQLYGDFPQCNEKIAVGLDWCQVLMTNVTDLMEQCRFEESDPQVNRSIRKDLALIIATCEAWDKQLTEEGK